MTEELKEGEAKEEVIATDAHVEIMLSHDYCHFEISLGMKKETGLTRTDVNNLRKQAQKLADEAVRQYKVAKVEAQKVLTYNEQQIKEAVKNINKIPPSEWSPQMKATVKVWNKHCYRKQQPYSYDDDWGEDPVDERDYYDDDHEDDIPY